MSFIDFVAGCWGGACGVLVGHPLDTIKVRLQTTNDVVKLTSLYNKNQKLGGLYAGLSSPLTCLAFVNAIVFGVYGNLNEYLKKREKLETTRSKVTREFIAGAIAGVAQCTITCPMELVKCRMQMYSNGNGGGNGLPSAQATVMDIIRKIKSEEKLVLRGLFRGFVPTLLRDAPAFGIYFSSFQYLIDREPNQTEASLLMAGGIAGTLSWLFIYPIDVIKTKIQTEGYQYNYSTIRCYRAMLSESRIGLRIFFRGFVPTLVRAFPVNAVTFYVVNKTFVIYENFFSPSASVSSASSSLSTAQD